MAPRISVCFSHLKRWQGWARQIRSGDRRSAGDGRSRLLAPGGREISCQHLVFGPVLATTVFKAGWFESTLANLIVFALLVIVFVLGVLIQLPGRTGRDAG